LNKINIKIVEVDQDSHTVLVKYVSESSNKNIDDYPAVAFQITNYNVSSLDEFIEAIRPQISLYVWQRDQAENPLIPVDISSWHGHTTEVDAFELPAAAIPESQLPPSASPEITV
jgi:hypothetical protein